MLFITQLEEQGLWRCKEGGFRDGPSKENKIQTSCIAVLKLDQRVRMRKKDVRLQFCIVGFPQAKPFCQWYVYVVTRPGHLPPDDATDVSLPGISKKFIRKVPKMAIFKGSQLVQTIILGIQRCRCYYIDSRFPTVNFRHGVSESGWSWVSFSTRTRWLRSGSCLNGSSGRNFELASNTWKTHSTYHQISGNWNSWGFPHLITCWSLYWTHKKNRFHLHLHHLFITDKENWSSWFRASGKLPCTTRPQRSPGRAFREDHNLGRKVGKKQKHQVERLKKGR